MSTCERPKEKAASIALGNLGPVDSRPASRPQSLKIYIISLFTAVVFFGGGSTAALIDRLSNKSSVQLWSNFQAVVPETYSSSLLELRTVWPTTGVPSVYPPTDCSIVQSLSSAGLGSVLS